jgi:hypothetical protein
MRLTLLVILLALSVGSAVICRGMARRRGDDGVTWVVMGLLLGPLAFPLLWLMLGRVPGSSSTGEPPSRGV